jgi:hypothetical protein
VMAVSGIVVPTLGTRSEYLKKCLESIRSSGDAFILLIGPVDKDFSELQSRGLMDQFVVDPARGLPAAINIGMATLPKEIEFVSWLGDDDLLLPGALRMAERVLQSNQNLTFVYGGCQYIDELGQVIWHNKSGAWARYLLRVGPDLIPQPGSLIRRKFFEECGGLGENQKLAFDVDLFIKLTKLGPSKHIPKIFASFRWHSGSLSVAERLLSVQEASEVRISHLAPLLKGLSFLWEPFVRWITLNAHRAVFEKGDR